MNGLPRIRACCLLLLMNSFFSSVAVADTVTHQEAKFASKTGNILYLALGVGLPLLEDGDQGEAHALRTLDSFGTSVLISQALKAAIREKRPDSNHRDSFPSGHATAAFAIAAMESHYHPRQSWLWYTGAVLIAESRTRLHRHFWQDVIAGSALGYFTSLAEIRSRHGLILSPFISSSHEGMGLQVDRSF
jgi:membrane-associated phospholipid phosphatase